MTETSNAQTTVSPASAAADLRLRLELPRVPLTLLDGAWWPRSGDPVAELPALIRAIQQSRGYLSHVMLHSDGWESTPRRLDVDGHMVRVAWFTSGPAGLLTTTSHGRDRVDLLVVPADAADGPAEVAMAAAADASNTMRAPEILAAIVQGPAEQNANEGREGDLSRHSAA
jgi:hypothetical protein